MHHDKQACGCGIRLIPCRFLKPRCVFCGVLLALRFRRCYRRIKLSHRWHSKVLRASYRRWIYVMSVLAVGVIIAWHSFGFTRRKRKYRTSLFNNNKKILEATMELTIAALVRRRPFLSLNLQSFLFLEQLPKSLPLPNQTDLCIRFSLCSSCCRRTDNPLWRSLSVR